MSLPEDKMLQNFRRCSTCLFSDLFFVRDSVSKGRIEEPAQCSVNTNEIFKYELVEVPHLANR